MNKQQRQQTQANKYVSEFIRCKNNFKYFCSKYIWLELPGGDQNLFLYNKQKELIDLIEKEHYVIVAKSRQIGISTIVEAYIAWMAIFYRNSVIGIISKDGKEATDFARTIRVFIEKLPTWMKPVGSFGHGEKKKKKSEQSFILGNGSKVFAATVSPQAPGKVLRGKSITFLVVDEIAFISKMDEAWTSLVPALATNQKSARKAGVPYGTILLSTPNRTVGIGAFYFKHWSKAISGDSIFKPFIIHWKMISELANDPEWYSNQCKLFDNDPRKIQQELEIKFLSTEGSFFESTTVEKIQESSKIEPIEKIKIFNGEIWKFQNPIPGQYYLIGVDTATEYGEDKSAITVWDYETLEQVWEYQGKCKVLDFVKVVKVACGIYRNGLVIIESNACGNQVREQINDSPEFCTMIYKEKRGENTLIPGISTSGKTRPLMIDALYSYVTEFPEIIKSERLALELSGLISKPNGRVEADEGVHDDIAMSASFCFFVRKYQSSRLLINPQKVTEQSNEMSKIMNMNQDILNLSEFSNPDVIKHVKDNIEDFGGVTDILSLYNNL